MHIYCIRNVINGKVYVGKSNRSIGVREREHLKFALEGKTYCPHLYSAIRAHGADAFEIGLLEKCASSLADLNDLEKHYITEYRANDPQCGYNLTSGGEGLVNPSEEVRQKMRNAKLGTKQSEKTKRKRGLALKGNTNASHVQSAEERAMRSRISSRHMLGKTVPKNVREKIAASVREVVKNQPRVNGRFAARTG